MPVSSTPERAAAAAALQSLFWALLCSHKHGATEAEWAEAILGGQLFFFLFALSYFSYWRMLTGRADLCTSWLLGITFSPVSLGCSSFSAVSLKSAGG